MDYKEFIDMVLSEVCADDRIKEGIIYVENTEHMLVLKEYVEKHTDKEFSDAVTSVLQSVLCLQNGNLREGNYPERQAYNKDGTLVTFPDPESKKAAIERGTHFDKAPVGTQSNDDSDDDSSEPDNEPEEEEDEVNIFSSDSTPEQEREKDERFFKWIPAGTHISPEDIRLKDDSTESSKERHRLYDILKSIKTAKDEDDVFDVSSEEGDDFQLDKLHPSVLFALHEKWVFDRAGDWYDEFRKFKGDTDRRGQVHPAKTVDKEKMDMWIDDYEKRQAGIELPDQEI